MNLGLKQKIIWIVILIGIALIAIFQYGLVPNQAQNQAQKPTQEQPQSEQHAKLVSTSPSPFDNSIILPTQTLEFTFSDPIENPGELKIRLEPETEIEVSLSDDKKTAKVTPKKSFDLGQSYTLFITSDTKFEGGKKLDQNLQFGFRTIEYNGV
jgi:hypothetical protein